MSINKLSRSATLGRVVYNLVITVGAAGAVSSFQGDDILAVTKNADAGEYEIELRELADQSFVRVLNVDMALSGATLEVLFAHVQADTVSTNNKFIVQLLSTVAAAANVTAANKIHLTIEVEAK